MIFRDANSAESNTIFFVDNREKFQMSLEMHSVSTIH